MKLVLLFLFFIHHVVCNTTQQIDFSNVVYEFHPCSESGEILETFQNSGTPKYNLTLLLTKFENLPKSNKFKIKYDSLANSTMNFPVKYYFDDSYSLEFSTNFEKPMDITITISSLWNEQLPNILSIKMNSEEICTGYIYKNIWDNYYTKITTTSSKIETTTRKIDEKVKCGERTIYDHGFIVGGSKSNPGMWPWHTAIYRLQLNGDPKYICGGSLISKTSVVTAGHCVVESNSIILAERIITIFGKYNFIGDNVHVQEKKVFKIILHSNFSYVNLQNDIAILKLSSEIEYNEYVQPICLLSEDDDYKKIIKNLSFGYVAGWGATGNETTASHLMETKLPVVKNIICMRSHPIFLLKLVMDGSYCAGYQNGTNVCNGDSGSGMYFELKNKHEKSRWYLGGIVSLGIPKKNQQECDPYQYSLFTDLFYQKHFVNDNL